MDTQELLTKNDKWMYFKIKFHVQCCGMYGQLVSGNLGTIDFWVWMTKSICICVIFAQNYSNAKLILILKILFMNPLNKQFVQLFHSFRTEYPVKRILLILLFSLKNILCTWLKWISPGHVQNFCQIFFVWFWYV